MTKRFGFAAMTIALLASLLTSAEAQMSSTPPDKPRSRQVIASASSAAVRFSCLGDLIQMRLEVFGASGEVLFDSDFRSTNLIDWSAEDRQGQKLADGSYLCVVSVKDPSGQIAQTRATSTLNNQSVRLSRSDLALLTPAQVEAAGRLAAEDAGLTILEQGHSQASAVLAHDGTNALLVTGSGALSISAGDFFSNNVLEHIRLNAEGSVGIGTSNPQAKLDVDGLIRASKGIVFPDGSIQLSAARHTLGAASLKPGESDITEQSKKSKISPAIAGTGTTGKISKWQDGPNGVLTDSVITELNGSIGINGTPDPTYKLDVTGHNRFRGSNVSFYLTGAKVGGNEWLFQTIDADGRLRVFENSTGGGERFSLSQNGNVGIGVSVPGSRLTVAGVIESATGGFKFPDGSVQTTAAAGGGSVVHNTTLSGNGTTGSPLGVAFPLNTTVSSANPVFSASNNGSGHGISGGSGNGIGVTGASTNNDGVYGQTFSATHTGVFGTNFGGGYGVTGTATSTGQLSDSPAGVWGNNTSTGFGVKGTSAGIAIYGEGSVGVHGFSSGGLGVRGVSTDGFGVRGDSTTGDGVRGVGLNGVQGFGTNAGVKGQSSSGFGLAGYTTNGTGVYGDNGNSNTTGHAGYFNGRVTVTGNLFANNLAGGKFSQQHTTSGNAIAPGGTVVDTVTIVAPDRGVLFISAFVNIVTVMAGYLQYDYVLQDGGGTTLTLTTEEDSNEGDKVQRSTHLSWMLRVEAGQSVTLRTMLVPGVWATPENKFYDHNLSVVYLRTEY